MHHLSDGVVAVRDARDLSRFHSHSHDAGIDLEEAFALMMVENEREYPVEASRGRANKYDDL
jgi:hypothetical protein